MDGRDEPGDAAQQGALAGAGLAEQRHDLAFVELEVDAVEHDERLAVGRGEVLGDVLDSDDGGAGSSVRGCGGRVVWVGVTSSPHGQSEYLVSARR